MELESKKKREKRDGDEEELGAIIAAAIAVVGRVSGGVVGARVSSGLAL